MAKDKKPKEEKPTIKSKPKPEPKPEPKVEFNAQEIIGWYRPPNPKEDYEIHFFVAGKSICGKYNSLDATWKKAKRDPEVNDDCAGCYSEQHKFTGQR